MNYQAPKITIDDSLLIQIYLCYLLEQLGNLTEEQLSDIITECEAVNFFAYLEALSVMCEKEMIEKSQEKNTSVYHLLPTGKLMAQEFYRRIPLSIREKSIEYGHKVLEMAELERSIICSIEHTRDNNIYLSLRFLNEMGGPDLMDLKIFAPDLEQARQMRERFLEKPSDIVTKVMNYFIKNSFL